MKKDIHPEYREVVFQDVQSDFKFLTRSTMSSDEKIKWKDGKEYPLIKVEVSSASHPFYTGKKIFVDTAGRVEKFNQKYKAKQVVKQQEVKKEALKEEVKEVKNGFECGVMLENYSDIKIGDIIETYEEVKTERKL